jgi:hypothetical protein
MRLHIPHAVTAVSPPAASIPTIPCHTSFPTFCGKEKKKKPKQSAS